MKLTRNLGLLLLGIYLILRGLSSLFAIRFSGLPIIWGILTLAAGLSLLLLERDNP